jgi:hypothetical protein
MRRRDFNRLAAAAGALAGFAPLAPRFATVTHAQQAILERINALTSSQMGVNEAQRALKFAARSGALWTRWTVQWFNAEKQVGKVDPFYFQGLDKLSEQMAVAAMVVGTPDHSGSGGPTAQPKGLYEPAMTGGAPNPGNRFAEFMFNLAKDLRGKIETFEIWNEAEIPATGSNAVYNTWSGDAAAYKQLVKVGAQAAKSANPNAKIITSPYSYFKDLEEGKSETLPFWDAFEAAVREDGEMASLIDGVALNLYRNPHDLWDRAWGAVPDYYAKPDKTGFMQRIQRMGLAGKELWLTEINAMPYDDAVLDWNPGAKSRQAEPLGLRLTMDEQAAYVWQALAIAVAAGWSKVNFHSLVDEVQGGHIVDELWGLVRHNNDANNGDESRARPAFWAYTLASRLLGDADMAQLYIRVRPDAVLSKHRQNASRYKWGAQAVVAQKGDLRTTVIWNNSPDRITVNVAAKGGGEAILIDKLGNPQPLQANGGRYAIPVNPATVRFSWPDSPFGPLEDPVNYVYVGGDPMILIETGVGDLSVDIANFTRKDARPEDGSGPDATGAGDVVDNGPGMNPRIVGHDPARIGRLS